MRLQDARSSGNIEDRRGFSPRGGGMGIRTGGLGLGGLLVLVVLGWVFGGDPMSFLSNDGVSPGVETGPAPSGVPPTDEPAQFAAKVLADTEDTWTTLFRARNLRYPQPSLVLFTDAVDSACGLNSSAVGPFYCPRDQKVYLDLGFYRELARRFGAPGDFAQAYVIAHEVGHHVQNVQGVLASGGMSRADANAQSVRQELQADCLAGVWGHAAAQRGLLETGDVEEGLNAAAAIGDDTLQRQAGGRVAPESFTHGSSADRVTAFRRGLDRGDMGACGL